MGASGTFGSPSPDDFDGLLAMFGEVLEAFDGLESEPPGEGEHYITQTDERLWSISRVRPRLILAAGYVAHVV